MKYIEKGAQPAILNQWINSVEPNNKNYNSLSTDPIKIEIQQMILDEQGHICCYCENKIEIDESHIEHIRPQDKYPNLDCDYTNLLVSCIKNPTKEKHKSHCGHYKGNWFDEGVFVSPLDPSCENRFGYREDGSIYGLDFNATETIAKLNLNSPKLIGLRFMLIKSFRYLSQEEISSYANSYLTEKNQGRYNPFYTTVKYLFA
jgi:uncharacterized protein (TIGR02646 family)